MNGIKFFMRYLCLILLAFAFCIPSAGQVTYQGDITSDKHAESNDNKSVSANVKLHFKVKPKVAIAIHNGTSFTSNPLFDASRLLVPTSVLSLEEGQLFPLVISSPLWGGESLDLGEVSGLVISGEFYLNTECRLFFGKYEPVKFTHEMGEANGTIYFLFEFFTEFGVLDFKPGELMGVLADPSYMNEMGAKGVISFFGGGTLESNSLDPSDRAGYYYGSYTLSAATV